MSVGFQLTVDTNNYVSHNQLEQGFWRVLTDKEKFLVANKDCSTPLGIPLGTPFSVYFGADEYYVEVESGNLIGIEKLSLNCKRWENIEGFLTGDNTSYLYCSLLEDYLPFPKNTGVDHESTN